MDKKYILVVEDDESLNKAYCDKLSLTGFEVVGVFNGKQAHQSIQKRIPDLILLDILMPKQDGFDFLEELYIKEHHTDIPVLILTNLSQEEDKEHGKKLGAHNFLVKADVSLDDVIEKINELIKI